jgi:hypothetical protein
MTPTLEQVKDYFKNAKDVKSIFDTIFEINIDSIEYDDAKKSYYAKGEDDILKCIYRNKYAKIMSYKDDLETPKHYDNSKVSLYQFCENQQLNSYEFDIIKRVVRSRKKGNFKEDLEKTKVLIDLYLKEYGK